MPYIKQEDRKKFLYTPAKLGPNSEVDLLAKAAENCDTPGDLNYAFTVLCHGYLRKQGLNYQHLNDCIGALEGCKQEIYRRVAAPYEDLKIAENGDVKGI
jgi:hypothetical protein